MCGNKCVFVCVVPSSSHSCLYLSVMVVPCCLHRASLGSPMNWSVISVNMRAPLESLIFSISLTCRDRWGIVGKSCHTGNHDWCLMGMILLPCWTVSWAAFLSHGTRPGRERAWPVPEPAPHPGASSSRRQCWRPPLDLELLQCTRGFSQQLIKTSQTNWCWHLFTSSYSSAATPRC